MNKLIDRNGLQDEFDMEPVEDEIKDITKNIVEGPMETLKENISKANTVIDILMHEMENGNLSARIAEVSGQLINCITNASKEIISGTNYSAYLHIKEKMLELKRMEIEIKQKKLEKPGGDTGLIIADRETILRLLDDENKNGG